MAQAEDELLDAVDDDDEDERTAVVSVPSLRPAARHARDRHLLVQVHGANVGHIHVLGSEVVQIGRQQGSTLWLGDGGISRRHARIAPEGEGYVLEDLGSANGTFVAGHQVKRHQLADGDVIQFGPGVMLRYTITDAGQEQMLRRLYAQSVTDSLTGAYNREHFDDRLLSELSFARRHEVPLSLVLIDLDHFKRVNDTHGHLAGDMVLIEVSRAITRALRNEDVFARYGGEEFAVILRGIDVVGAAKLAERLRALVAGLDLSYEAVPVPVTLSAGCASLACIDDPTPEGLIGCADRRLYSAKHAGRNRVVSEG